MPILTVELIFQLSLQGSILTFKILTHEKKLSLGKSVHNNILEEVPRRTGTMTTGQEVAVMLRLLE